MVEQQVDILIIGGGLIGATLLRALSQLGYNTLLVDKHSLSIKERPNFDARSLALSPASVRILAMLDLWDLLADKVCPIEHIHISDQQRFGVSRLHAKSNEPLGVVVEMHHINHALHQALSAESILAPATVTHLNLEERYALVSTDNGMRKVNACLFIAADGAQSITRSFSDLRAEVKDFNQHAIVANIGLNKPHNYHAFERFTQQGPLALLPMQDNKMSLVWAMSPQRAQKLMASDERLFLRELQHAFGYRLGRLAKVGARACYPLQQSWMPLQARWPVVFIGNAAHTLHPVAGQGFNLGLRDVAGLAQCIAQNGLTPKMLAQYLELRARDQKNIMQFTNGLLNVFTSRLPGIGFARDLALFLLDNSLFLKHCLSRCAQGYSGIIPDLVCGIALDKQGGK